MSVCYTFCSETPRCPCLTYIHSYGFYQVNAVTQWSHTVTWWSHTVTWWSHDGHMMVTWLSHYTPPTSVNASRSGLNCSIRNFIMDVWPLIAWMWRAVCPSWNAEHKRCIHQIGKMNNQSEHKISEHKWKFSTYVHIYRSVCTYICMYVCMYVCIYVCSVSIPTKQ